MTTSKAELPWYWLGRVSVTDAFAIQNDLRTRRLVGDNSAEALLLLEHEPTITLGKNASSRDIVATPKMLAREGIETVYSNRGGLATYHGPGQLIVYVVRKVKSIVEHLQNLAIGLSDVAHCLGVPGARWRRDPAGLWVGDRKLAACGVHVRRGVTIHGFSLNVSTPPKIWRHIVPCGMPMARMTSIVQEANPHDGNPTPNIATVAHLAAPLLCAALNRTPRQASARTLRTSTGICFSLESL